MLRFALLLSLCLPLAESYAWMAKIKAPSLMNLRKMQKGSKFGDKMLGARPKEIKRGYRP